jgi:hypothetical protein
MAGNVTAAENDILEARELSPEEIDAVSGAWSVELFGFRVTGSDVASAAKWVWTSSSSPQLLQGPLLHSSGGPSGIARVESVFASAGGLKARDCCRERRITPLVLAPAVRRDHRSRSQRRVLQHDRQLPS